MTGEFKMPECEHTRPLNNSVITIRAGVVPTCSFCERDRMVAELTDLRAQLDHAVSENLAFNIKVSREINELRAQRNAALQRRFPIMGEPSVPWEIVAPFEAQAKINHDQTLERLAERGGLAPEELWCLVHGTSLRNRPTGGVALVWLRDWLAECEGARAELAAMTAARDEACDLAKDLNGNMGDEEAENETRDRIAELRKVGAK